MLVIPLGKSQLYVEPVFLQAEAGGLPELKRVIVAAGEHIAMETTLEGSLKAIFGAEMPPTEIVVEPPPEVEPPAAVEPEAPAVAGISELVEEAVEHYNRAQQYLQAGDWTGYGQELDALKAVLDELAEIAAEE